MISKHTKKRASDARLLEVAGGARRLYEVLWLVAESGSRAGRGLQCKAAHISSKSYKQSLAELVGEDLVELDYLGTRLQSITL